MPREPKKLERLSDRDLMILRQLRAKIGAYDIGDRVNANMTAAEAVMALRALDFAEQAELLLREYDRKAREDVERLRRLAGPKISDVATPPQIEDKSNPTED